MGYGDAPGGANRILGADKSAGRRTPRLRGRRRPFFQSSSVHGFAVPSLGKRVRDRRDARGHSQLRKILNEGPEELHRPTLPPLVSLTVPIETARSTKTVRSRARVAVADHAATGQALYQVGLRGERAALPDAVVMTTLQPSAGVRGSCLDQGLEELGREEEVAEQLAAAT
jgi:hypothetical protein